MLGSHNTARRQFSSEDVDFAQAVANVLGAAVERRRHEEVQERAGHNERLAAVGQRTAGVAHDFTNIVSTIGYSTRLLEANQGLDDAGRQHLAAIGDQVDRATSLVWQVLDLAHSRPPQRADEDLVAVLGDLLPEIDRVLAPGLSVHMDHDDEGYVVGADRTALAQIFTNLASNANDATDGPGELRITLSSHEVSSAERPPLEGMAPGRWVRVDVADTGTGMAPDVLERVFEPFFTTKAPGHGTGVGLNQVLRLAAEHDGHVDVASQPGQGTTVSIWLPAAGGAMVYVEPAPASESISVVVCDDHAVLAQCLAASLSGEPDIDVVGVAGSVAEVLAMAEATRPQVVLMDYELPDGDGVRATRALKAAHPLTEVVMLTSYTDKVVLVAAIEAGCSGYVTKHKGKDEVAAGVRLAAAGEALISPAMLSRLLPRLAQTRPGAGFALTEREREVLELMAAGANRNVIAERLVLCGNTVRNHMQAILRKLGAHSSLEAVATAARAGIIRR